MKIEESIVGLLFLFGFLEREIISGVLKEGKVLEVNAKFISKVDYMFLFLCCPSDTKWQFMGLNCG